MFDTSREGELCEHIVHGVNRGILTGGPRVIFVAEEIHEEGTKEWVCPDTFDAPCGWSRHDGFIETSTLVAGVVTARGVALSPLPIELPDAIDYGWHMAVDQDQEGGVHLLIYQSDHTVNELRYMRLACHEQ